MASMQPLRTEHAELLPHIQALAAAGDHVGDADVVALRTEVDASYRFLVDSLMPHAEAEERTLYPMVQRVLGSPQATATMTRDHAEIHRLTEELGELRDRLTQAGSVDGDLANALRRVLYGLYALVRVHFAEEEDVFLPLLQAGLTDAEAEHMFSAMHGEQHHHH
jgi:iron-sulfur cluster repair protein YtfE (RIC family)